MKIKYEQIRAWCEKHTFQINIFAVVMIIFLLFPVMNHWTEIKSKNECSSYALEIKQPTYYGIPLSSGYTCSTKIDGKYIGLNPQRVAMLKELRN